MRGQRSEESVHVLLRLPGLASCPCMRIEGLAKYEQKRGHFCDLARAAPSKTKDIQIDVSRPLYFPYVRTSYCLANHSLRRVQCVGNGPGANLGPSESPAKSRLGVGKIFVPLRQPTESG